MQQSCRCKRCTSHQPHDLFDPAGLERLMDRLHPPVYPPAMRLGSSDREVRCTKVTPIRKHGGNTRQPWQPRPARTAA